MEPFKLPVQEGTHPVDAVTAFDAVRLELRAEFGEREYASYVRHLECGGLRDGALLLIADNSVVRDWANRNAVDRIEARLRAHGAPYPVEVIAARDAPADLTPVRAARPAATLQPVSSSGPLAPDMTFANFVSGASNYRAFTVAQMVASGAAVAFPLVLLHGPPGVGKTHLLMSIAHEVSRQQPQRKVLYMMSQAFLEDFQAALHRKKDAAGFKQYVREPDLLLLDDVQRLAGKRATEEEFFDTIAMYRAKCGGQVVMTADHGPTGLTGFDERLKQQLKSATACEVGEPDRAMRRAILDRCVARQQRLWPEFSVSDGALDMIADRLEASGRILDGAIAQLVVEARISGAEVTMEAAQDALQNKFAVHSEHRRITVQRVLKVVANYYGMSVPEMLARTRQRAIARPRQVAMHLACKLTSASLPDIGRRFSMTENPYDHTTVMYGRDKIAELAETDTKLRQDLSRLEYELRNGE
jgi:chromosomal replication initiator protein